MTEQATSAEIRTQAQAGAAVRIAIACLVLFAPRLSGRVIGVPEDHDTPSGRMFARLFGVREIILAAVVMKSLHDRPMLRWAMKLNAAADAGDVASVAVPLVKRQGIDRPALMSIVPAALGFATWLRLLKLDQKD